METERVIFSPKKPPVSYTILFLYIACVLSFLFVFSLGAYYVHPFETAFGILWPLSILVIIPLLFPHLKYKILAYVILIVPSMSLDNLNSVEFAVLRLIYHVIAIGFAIIIGHFIINFLSLKKYRIYGIIFLILIIISNLSYIYYFKNGVSKGDDNENLFQNYINPLYKAAITENKTISAEELEKYCLRIDLNAIPRENWITARQECERDVREIREYGKMITRKYYLDYS